MAVYCRAGQEWLAWGFSGGTISQGIWAAWEILLWARRLRKGGFGPIALMLCQVAPPRRTRLHTRLVRILSSGQGIRESVRIDGVRQCGGGK